MNVSCDYEAPMQMLTTEKKKSRRAPAVTLLAQCHQHLDDTVSSTAWWHGVIKVLKQTK